MLQHVPMAATSNGDWRGLLTGALMARAYLLGRRLTPDAVVPTQKARRTASLPVTPWSPPRTGLLGPLQPVPGALQEPSGSRTLCLVQKQQLHSEPAEPPAGNAVLRRAPRPAASPPQLTAQVDLMSRQPLGGARKRSAEPSNLREWLAAAFGRKRASSTQMDQLKEEQELLLKAVEAERDMQSAFSHLDPEAHLAAPEPMQA